MSFLVVFTSEAQDQLIELYRYIASKFSEETATRYVAKLIDHCEKLGTFPERGIRRDDLHPGLRITHYRSHTTIAFVTQPNRIEI